MSACPRCEGQGWTAEHEPGCDGNCGQGCPVQEQCAACHATGDTLAVEPRETLTHYLRAGDRIRLWDGHLFGIEHIERGVTNIGRILAFTGEDENTGQQRTVFYAPSVFVAAETLPRAEAAR